MLRTNPSATGSAPSGYGLEGTLGYLINAAPDTNPLYGCIQNSDQFLSKDRGCEGQTLLGLEGWIYDDPPPNVATVAVYRCSVPGSDHFAADDPNCEGQHTDGLLGYALGQPVPVPTATPSAPATTSIPQPISPSHPHARLIHTRLRFEWRWRRASTRLRKGTIGHLPREGERLPAARAAGHTQAHPKVDPVLDRTHLPARRPYLGLGDRTRLPAHPRPDHQPCQQDPDGGAPMIGRLIPVELR